MKFGKIMYGKIVYTSVQNFSQKLVLQILTINLTFNR